MNQSTPVVRKQSLFLHTETMQQEIVLDKVKDIKNVSHGKWNKINIYFSIINFALWVQSNYADMVFFCGHFQISVEVRLIYINNTLIEIY